LATPVHSLSAKAPQRGGPDIVKGTELQQHRWMSDDDAFDRQESEGQHPGTSRALKAR
jgi:hypothetical protein